MPKNYCHANFLYYSKLKKIQYIEIFEFFEKSHFHIFDTFGRPTRRLSILNVLKYIVTFPEGGTIY